MVSIMKIQYLREQKEVGLSYGWQTGVTSHSRSHRRLRTRSHVARSEQLMLAFSCERALLGIKTAQGLLATMRSLFLPVCLACTLSVAAASPQSSQTTPAGPAGSSSSSAKSKKTGKQADTSATSQGDQAKSKTAKSETENKAKDYSQESFVIEQLHSRY